MSSRGTVRALFVVVVLTGLAVLYLYQHWRSVQLTRTDVQLEQERRLLGEKVESLEVELAKLQSFCLIDSIYHAEGFGEERREFVESEGDEAKNRVHVAVAGVQLGDERR